MRQPVWAMVAVGLAVLGAVGGWPACAPGQGVAASTAPMASEAEIQALRERVAAFWAARVAGDLEAQWQLLEPRWKGRMTAAEYGGDLTGGRWLAYKVEDTAVSGLFAAVKVRLLVQQILPAGSPGRSVRGAPQAAIIEDPWIRIGGVWYRRLDGGTPPPSQTGQQ